MTTTPRKAIQQIACGILLMLMLFMASVFIGWYIGDLWPYLAWFLWLLFLWRASAPMRKIKS